MSDKAKRVIHKYYEYVMTKLDILWAQRVFTSENTRVKYILKTNKVSKDLVVVLSSCTRKGIKARYNYMKSLKSINCNKLFILDDYAEDHRGSYYLGEGLRFNEETAVHKLIRSVMEEIAAKQVFFCGSSKGGYAALNFGLEYEKSIIIAGAPQYFLGDYLIGSQNTEAFHHIVGNDESEEMKELLNQRLREKIKDLHRKADQTIYLHYSDKEHTYEEHVKHLIMDLRERNQVLITDVADYTNHSDISYYFPDFLKMVLKKYI